MTPSEVIMTPGPSRGLNDMDAMKDVAVFYEKKQRGKPYK